MDDSPEDPRAKSAEALSRRDILRASAAFAAGSILQGCPSSPKAPPTPPTPGPGALPLSGGGVQKIARRVIDYTKTKASPTTCFGCTTQCHVLGWVQDERVVRITGHPLDPSSRGKTCAKADGLIASTYSPSRLLYPLRRSGPRGSGQWQRISWEEALDTIAKRIRKLMDDQRPDLFAIQVGRDKTQGLTSRFLNTVGSPHGLNRRSICSTNNRLGTMTYFGTAMDWGAPDLERTNYVLNFGSNLMEAHQGGFGGIGRLMDARVDRGAKLVTFEIRPSATASVSDEFHIVKAGSDGAIAMAMAHVIAREGLANRSFWDRWCNLPFDALIEHLAPFTPEKAEAASGVKAEDIRRLAREFAKAAPTCTTLMNRGAAKHMNGIHSARAIVLLDILVGNLGQPGGAGIVNRGPWKKDWGHWGLPVLDQPGPLPPKPPAWKPGMPCFDELPQEVKDRYEKLPESWKKRYQGEFITPVDYPLSWQWQVMKVGQMNYPWLKEKRTRLDTLFSYAWNGAYSHPEAKVCREVLKDESLIPFHVAIDIAMSETTALADIILPETTALERWDAQVTNSWTFVPITGLRQPLVPPAGECRGLWSIFRELARRLGPEANQYWDFPDEESFYKAWYKNLPISWEDFKRRGVWWDEGREPDFQLFERVVPESELKGAVLEEATGLMKKEGKTIGIKMGEAVLRGFPSPSGKIEVFQPIFSEAAQLCGLSEHPIASPLPGWFPVPAFEAMEASELRFVTFKWNVHTQGRTAHHKYQAEIVHGNPIWISPETAKSLNLQTGDKVELTLRRPRGPVWGADDEADCDRFVNRVRVVPGVSPGLVACSHHLGHWEHGALARGQPKRAQAGIEGMEPESFADRDLLENVWWLEDKGGSGTGVFINDAMPIAPTPLSGGQMWFDGVCKLRKIGV